VLRDVSFRIEPGQVAAVVGLSGTGKTTIALRFLIEGSKVGDRGMYVTLSETEEELRAVASSHGWDLDGLTLRELTPSEEELEPDEQATMFHAPEMELAATLKRVLDDEQVASILEYASNYVRYRLDYM